MNLTLTIAKHSARFKSETRDYFGHESKKPDVILTSLWMTDQCETSHPTALVMMLAYRENIFWESHKPLVANDHNRKQKWSSWGKLWDGLVSYDIENIFSFSKKRNLQHKRFRGRTSKSNNEYFGSCVSPRGDPSNTKCEEVMRPWTHTLKRSYRPNPRRHACIEEEATRISHRPHIAWYQLAYVLFVDITMVANKMARFICRIQTSRG